MSYLGSPFCSVCKEQTIDRIYQLVTPIDDFSPSDNFQTYTGGTINFTLDLVLPEPNTLKIEWGLNGTIIASNVSQLSLDNSILPAGESTLTVTVTDTTMLSQKNISGYAFSVSWEITNTTVALVEADSRLFYKIYPNPATKTMYVEFDGDFPAKETVVQLVTPSGQIVFTEKKQLTQKSVLEFSVSQFPKGNYFLKIQRGNVFQTVPVVLFP